MKQSRRSISAARLACKCYKWGEACGCAGGFQHQGVAGLAACGERATARGCMQRSRSSHTPLFAQADLCREAITPSPQDIAMPFGDVTFDVTFVPGSQGLAASIAHDAGNDEVAVTLNRYIVVFRATLRRPSEAQICGCWQGSEPIGLGGSNFQS